MGENARIPQQPSAREQFVQFRRSPAAEQLEFLCYAFIDSDAPWLKLVSARMAANLVNGMVHAQRQEFFFLAERDPASPWRKLLYGMQRHLDEFKRQLEKLGRPTKKELRAEVQRLRGLDAKEWTFGRISMQLNETRGLKTTAASVRMLLKRKPKQRT